MWQFTLQHRFADTLRAGISKRFSMLLFGLPESYLKMSSPATLASPQLSISDAEVCLKFPSLKS